jgi:transketolase
MNTSSILETGAAISAQGTLSGGSIRRIIIEQSKRAGVGHIGSALSVADMVSALFGQVIEVPSPGHPERDRFILSKGHAALALYAAFHLRGWISQDELDTFCADGSRLGVHPEYALPGVDFSTGSLGQGLSFGAGAALAARRQRSSRRVFVLMSDAELNEGSVWEAVMFAAHHKLANLIAIIDWNGQQAFGYTRDVIDQSRITERLTSFGWDAHNVDGHNVSKMVGLMRGFNTTDGAPHVLIAHTTFGKGVSFMERQIKWHYCPLSDQDYAQASQEVGKAP